MFIIQGLLNTPSLVLYSSKNRLKTCEQFALLDPQIPMQGAQLTALLPFYRMIRLQSSIYFSLVHSSFTFHIHKQFFFHAFIVYTPTPFLLGKVKPPTKFSKRGGLTGCQLLDGGYWEREGTGKFQLRI